MVSSFKSQILCLEVSIFVDAVSKNFASGRSIFTDFRSLLAVSVYYSLLTVIEKLELAIEIVIHVRMLFRSDVVLIEVCESRSTVFDAVYPVKLQSLR